MLSNLECNRHEIKALIKEQDHRLQSIELLTQLLTVNNDHLKDKFSEMIKDDRKPHYG